MVAIPKPSDRLPLKPVCCRVPTVRRSLPVAKRRRWLPPHLAPPVMSSVLIPCMARSRKRFLLHYNFPPFSVGETSFRLGPGRREIGHGIWQSGLFRQFFLSMMSFPYTIRIVSETLESNGSSSMAAVCGGSLSLMDAGIPIKAPVAGIAMGLIKEGDDVAILSDILGDEDHLGDMDFKVAGTAEGVTALQMDIKIGGVTREIMEKALEAGT